MPKGLSAESYACALGESCHIPDAVEVAGSRLLTAGAWLQVDDDSYVHVDALLNLLSKLPAQHLFLGNIDEGPGGPHRDPASPWHVTEEEWPSRHYPMWAHGAGYVLSKVSSRSFLPPMQATSSSPGWPFNEEGGPPETAREPSWGTGSSSGRILRWQPEWYSRPNGLQMDVIVMLKVALCLSLLCLRWLCACMQDLVREVAAGAALKASNHRIFKLEDIAMGSWVEYVAKERGWGVQYMSHAGFNFAGCASTDVVSHYIRPAQARCMFAKGGRSCCKSAQLEDGPTEVQPMRRALLGGLV